MPQVKRTELGENDENTPLLVSKAPLVRQHSLDPTESDNELSNHGTVALNNILLIPFFVYCMAMGAVAVPKLNVIIGLMCAQYGKGVGSTQLQSGDICNEAGIQKRVGHFMMCAHLISGLCCALSSQRIGQLSDRYGRKPLLAYTAIGLLFGDVMSILASWYPHRISVYWVLLEFAIGGLSGTFSATMAIIQAFVVDCTEGQSRVNIFSRYHAAMFLGVAIGPIAGELFVRTLGGSDMLSVFYAAALCHASFICFVLFGIRESLPTRMAGLPPDGVAKSKQSYREWLRSYPNPFGIFRSSSQDCFSASTANLPSLAAIDGIVFGINVGFPSVLILFAKYNFLWDSLKANSFVALSNSTRALTLMVLLPVVLHLASKRSLRGSEAGDRNEEIKSSRLEVIVVRLALVADVASHIGFAFAGNTLTVMLWGVPAAMGAVISPIAQSLMSSSVARDRIGELFGTISLIHALSRSVIPAGMQLIYSSTVDWLSGTVFIVLSCVYGIALLLALRLRT